MIRRRRIVRRRNPIAALLRAADRRFALRRGRDVRRYRRHPRHRHGPLAPSNFGWVP